MGNQFYAKDISQIGMADLLKKRENISMQILQDKFNEVREDVQTSDTIKRMRSLNVSFDASFNKANLETARHSDGQAVKSWED